ncbi:hypothetical protein C8R43DRAFT_1120215 [Mycena crocata]|nr:hypothetical protein C8R43DRAFT_1120215 [Mycena crocata]
MAVYSVVGILKDLIADVATPVYAYLDPVCSYLAPICTYLAPACANFASATFSISIVLYFARLVTNTVILASKLAHLVFKVITVALYVSGCLLEVWEGWVETLEWDLTFRLCTVLATKVDCWRRRSSRFPVVTFLLWSYFFQARFDEYVAAHIPAASTAPSQGQKTGMHLRRWLFALGNSLFTKLLAVAGGMFSAVGTLLTLTNEQRPCHDDAELFDADITLVDNNGNEATTKDKATAFALDLIKQSTSAPSTPPSSILALVSTAPAEPPVAVQTAPVEPIIEVKSKPSLNPAASTEPKPALNPAASVFGPTTHKALPSVATFETEFSPRTAPPSFWRCGGCAVPILPPSSRASPAPAAAPVRKEFVPRTAPPSYWKPGGRAVPIVPPVLSA